MALRKVQSASIADNAITSAKIASGAVTSSDIDSTVNSAVLTNAELLGASVKVPSGTTAQRPGSPATGMLRYNTTVAVLEQYTADGWVGIEPAPTISSIVYPNSQTAIWQGDTVTINGTGYRSGAIVKFLNAATGVITQADVTTRVSSTQITGTFPTSVSTEGTYTIIVTNPSGLSATLDNSLTVDGLAIWTTSSGSLGSYWANEPMTTTVAATEDGSSITSFAVLSGSLPGNVTLNTSTGVISGTPSDVYADTIYSFTIKAVDAENQSSTRTFTITILENYQQTGSTIFG